MLILHCPYCNSILRISYDLNFDSNNFVMALCPDENCCAFGVRADSIFELISIVKNLKAPEV